jgi:hypothetical protein
VVQALTTEAIAECIRNGGVWEAEMNIDLLALVSIPAASDRCGGHGGTHRSLTKRRRRKREFDHMREVACVPKADDLALAMSSPSAVSNSTT